MKSKRKILSIMLLIITCTSMVLFSKLDESFYCSATTLNVANVSDLSYVKQLVINTFYELSNVTTESFHDPCSTYGVIAKFNTIDTSEIEGFEDEFKLSDGIQICDELNLYRYEFESYITLNTLVELNQCDLVEYVEADYIVTPQAEISNSWGLKNQTYTGIDINVNKAWQKTKGSRSVVVAVIDTGVDFSHADLRTNIWLNSKEIANNGKDDDRNGYVDDILGWNFADNNNYPIDDDGHGTHVAGIIAARENNIGMVGIAPNVRIMPLDVFRGRSGSISSIIKAVKYAKSNGATIVNMSLTTTGYQQSLKDLMATASNILFVSASGNDAQNNNIYPKYPTNFNLPNNISVGSIEKNGTWSAFANYGTSVHIAAPGGSIYSTLPNNRYGYKGGTSMAAPHVAGVAALVKSAYPNYTPAQIKNRLTSTSTKLSSLKGRVSSGGLVNAGKACGF